MRNEGKAPEKGAPVAPQVPPPEPTRRTINGHRGYVKVGEVNRFIGCVGEPGSGKTQEACKIALSIQKRGAYVLAVDPNHDMPLVLHDGTKTGIIRHKPDLTLSSVRAGLTSNPRAIHAVTTDNATPTIELAMEVAKLGMTEPDKNGEQWGIPVVVLIDEITLWDEANTHRVGDTLKMIMTQRRHKHIIVLYGTQSPRLCHYQVFDRSSEMHMFHILAEDDRRRLEKGGVPEEICDSLPRLKKFQHIVYRRYM